MFGIGDIPVVGGVYKALTGETSYRAKAPVINTAAGQKSLELQSRAAAGRNAAMGYSLASSARGSSQALALREAQRRAMQGNVAMQGQANANALALEQAAMQQNAANQMQAQQINAGIEQGNAQGLGRFAGAALGAGGAMLLMSDQRAKVLEGQLATERAKNAQPQAMAPWLAQYGQQQGWNQPVAPPQPMAPPRVVWQDQSALAMPEAANTPAGMYRSDERAKVLADENKSLRDALSGMRAALEASGPAPMMMRGAASPAAGAVHAAAARVPRDREMSPAEQKMLDYNIEAGLTGHNQALNGQVVAVRPPGTPPGVSVIPPLAQQLAARDAEQRMAAHPIPPVRSDERSKMVFPEGIKPVAFEYKPGMGPDQEPHVGVLAQDVEKSPEGATVVKEDPATGMKELDIGGLSALNTAKLSELEKRLRKLEGR